jgi:FHA domain
MSMPDLMVVSGSAVGLQIPIPPEGLVVGREADALGGLEDDPFLSGRHARFILTESGRVFVEDLRSTNGTYVNGVRIADPVLLDEGDTIRVGNTSLRFGELRREPRDDTLSGVARGGVVIGDSVHATDGSIGVIGSVDGDVDLSRRYNYDASGLGLLIRARGAARFVLVLGLLISFVGFCLFGYPIVRGIVNAASGVAASRECDKLPPEEQFDCQVDAGGDFPSFTPWLPLGIALLLIGMVISTIGFFMIKHER